MVAFDLTISREDEVFSTPELLELILLHLDPRTLVVSAQRTCQYWNRLIRDSRSLQKALFFLPTDSGPTTRNPLLAEAFPSFFLPTDTQEALDSQAETVETDVVFSFFSWDMVQHPEKIEAYNRKEASWRRMLVQQPPISDFAFFDSFSARRWTQEFSEQIVRPANLRYDPNPYEGLRMETLFDFMVLDGPISFDYERSHVIQWTDYPFSKPRWMRISPDLADAIEDDSAKFPLIIHQQKISGCIMMEDDHVTAEEKLRRLIFPSYADVPPDATAKLYEVVKVERERSKNNIPFVPVVGIL
ncbi:hypothetical protein N7462_006204 [Penicillium macrosclerotiorum]|uniref:uncharacterized protein n=1 Tax=Penicillium macrosclerotiorum TaxID=303699 RepID=UPI0025473024|nr:uncharacterized protein N7462_006204 [Penicillium macrosclerotiorum]KAJ5683039.1 hypothetical protein N7462_006204 [Penicillium macrosclerotiorum]